MTRENGDQPGSLFTVPVIIATVATYWITAIIWSSLNHTMARWERMGGWPAQLFRGDKE
jgi:hypothetical protein